MIAALPSLFGVFPAMFLLWFHGAEGPALQGHPRLGQAALAGSVGTLGLALPEWSGCYCCKHTQPTCCAAPKLPACLIPGLQRLKTGKDDEQVERILRPSIHRELCASVLLALVM